MGDDITPGGDTGDTVVTAGRLRMALRRAMAGKAIDAISVAHFDAGVWALYPPAPGKKGLEISMIPLDTSQFFSTPAPVPDQLEKLAVHVTSPAGQARIAELMPAGLAGLLFVAAATYRPMSARSLIAAQDAADKLIGMATAIDGTSVYGIYDVNGDGFHFCEADDLGSLNLDAVKELLYAIESMIPATATHEAHRLYITQHQHHPRELASFRFLPASAVGGRDTRLGPLGQNSG